MNIITMDVFARQPKVALRTFERLARRPGAKLCNIEADNHIFEVLAQDELPLTGEGIDLCRKYSAMR